MIVIVEFRYKYLDFMIERMAMCLHTILACLLLCGWCRQTILIVETKSSFFNTSSDSSIGERSDVVCMEMCE